MFKKDSVIVDIKRRRIYKVLEIDEPTQDYILSLIYPKPVSTEISRRDIHKTHDEYKLIF